MTLLALLPSEAPYRVDQVMAAPSLMAALFILQLLLAAGLSWSARCTRALGWWAMAAGLLLLTALFFALGSWGTSDVTKLSVWLEVSPARSTEGEPFWALVAPLILQLPYRMAAVHGLVAAGYGLAAILLARCWKQPAWAGWWCLFLTASPMLRGFLQNGQSRQALAVLLMVPLMLLASRLARVSWGLAAGSTAFSAMVHTTFPVNVGFAVLPLLVSAQPLPRLGAVATRHRWLWVLLLALLAVPLIATLGPVALQKLNSYTTEMRFFSHYSVKREVLVLEAVMAGSVALVCRLRQLGPRQLLRCPFTRVLGLFSLLYLGLQATVEWELWPQITFRLTDAAALFLLISYLAWLRHHRASWLLVPALLITLGYWWFGRILPSADFLCGQNDRFLCVPDRWPSEVRYR